MSNPNILLVSSFSSIFIDCKINFRLEKFINKITIEKKEATIKYNAIFIDWKEKMRLEGYYPEEKLNRWGERLRGSDIYARESRGS